jgi:hypothetical protein
MIEHGIVLFHNSFSAMRAEAVLMKAGLAVKLIPTPRDLSSDCGVSLRFDWSRSQQVEALLKQARVDTAGIYPLPSEKTGAVATLDLDCGSRQARS